MEIVSCDAIKRIIYHTSHECGTASDKNVKQDKLLGPRYVQIKPVVHTYQVLLLYFVVHPVYAVSYTHLTLPTIYSV